MSKFLSIDDFVELKDVTKKILANQFIPNVKAAFEKLDIIDIKIAGMNEQLLIGEYDVKFILQSNTYIVEDTEEYAQAVKEDIEKLYKLLGQTSKVSRIEIDTVDGLISFIMTADLKEEYSRREIEQLSQEAQIKFEDETDVQAPIATFEQQPNTELADVPTGFGKTDTSETAEIATEYDDKNVADSQSQF